MKTSNLRFVSSVFTVIGQDVVYHHTSDLIIDLPSAVESLDKGESVIIFARENGADNYRRFEDCIKSEKGNNVVPSVAMVYEYCEKTLGWDVVITLHPDQTIEINRNENGDLSQYNFNGLKNRLQQYIK